MAWKKEKEVKPKNPNSKEENDFLSEVLVDQTNSETGYRADVEKRWSDESLAYRGDQWDTSLAPRDRYKKSKRPNIVLNVSLPTIMNIVDALTASTPEADIVGREPSDKQVALKLSDLTQFIFDRNIFDKQWRDIVFQGVLHGPFIGSVEWDANFMGGAGPNRWIGEVITKCEKKDYIYFDPAIKDLEEDLQECRFIIQKVPTNLSVIADNWDNGKYVTAEMLDDDDETTDTSGGFNYKRANVIKYWHRGVPKFISESDKKRFQRLADKATDEYKKKEYQDMANGTLKGIHCSYSANGVFLEYVPYKYDDGLYPFVYGVLYQDQDNPYGFGEMKNILSPQIAYNKCAEIEMASAAVEGLGGGYFNKGSISKAQLEDMLENGHKAGVWHEVMSKEGMQKKEGTQTPQSLVLFKDFLKDNIDTITQNTAIQQGVSPGANVPFASIKELGSRADVRNKGKMNILERFMTQYIRLIISRIGQFYTEEREYRIRGNKSMAIKTALYDGFQNIMMMTDKQAQLASLIQLFETVQNANPNSSDEFGKFSNKEMTKTWERTADNGEKKEEEYIAEFDVKVKIADERPTARSYYEQVAMAMYGKALGPKGFWHIIDEGKFPPIEEILNELKEIQQGEQQAQAPQAPQGQPPIQAVG